MKPEQITAWALDEASPEERLHLEAALLENPQDKLKADETKAFCDFLLSELRDDSLALTEKQRSELKAQPVGQPSRVPSAGGRSALKPPAPRATRWNIGVIVRLAVAACVVLGGFWAWQSAASRRHGGLTQEMAAADRPTVRVSLPKAVDAKKNSNVETAMRQSAKNVPLEKQTAAAAGRVPPPAAPQTVTVSSSVALTKNQGGMTDRDVNELKKLQDQTAYGLSFGDMGQMQVPASPVPGATTAGVESASLLASTPAGFGNNPPSVTTTLSGSNTFTGGTTVNGGTLILGSSPPVMRQNAPTLAAAGNLNGISGASSVTFKSTAAPLSMPGASVQAVQGVNHLQVGPAVAGTGISVGTTISSNLVVTSAPSAQGAIPVTEGNVIAGTAIPVRKAAVIFWGGVVDGDVFTNGGTLALTSNEPAKLGAERMKSAPATPALDNATLSPIWRSSLSSPSSNNYFALKGAEVRGSTIQTAAGIPAAASASPGTTLPPPAAPAAVAVVMEPSPDIRYLAVDRVDLPTIQTAREKDATVTRKSEVSGESYTRIVENELKDVEREPLSTLSIDVDTASYANVRRFLNQNMTPPPDAVRIEELVNYFPTSEEGPAHDAKEPFGVRIEMAPCPWQPAHRLARIAIKGREMSDERKPSNLVFLVDVSGSMNEPAKLPLVQQSLRMLTEQLGEGDHVTMVVYAGSSGVVLPPTGGEKKGEILAAIDRLSAGGSTHGSAGIKLAYEQAVAGFIKGGVNRVILCTDGDFNVGVSSPEELEKLIKHKAKTGVFLSVLGFGSGNLKDRTMETLADKGNGNYAYIDSLSEARKVLVEQMSGTLVTIAKDVKIQVEFNPALVRSYRLIGYENRLLAKEDFNDDTKDAGEIGAGHSVVALYEVVPATLPAGAESRPAVDSLKYQAPAVPPAQLAEAAKNGEVMTVKLRYKEPDSSLSKLIETPVKDEGKTLTASSEEYKFSAAVAGFGLLLRDSSYKGTLSWETVRRLAMDGKGADKLGYRGEFLQLIDKARGLKETQN